MKRVLVCAVLASFSIFGFLSCGNQGGGDDLAYSLTIVNNSSRAVESVGLAYTGIKSRAPSVDYEKAVAIPPGNTITVNLVLDPSTNYYNLFMFNNTSSKRIIWDQAPPTYDYVLFSKGGSSTCTITDLQTNCFAGENSANPYSFDW